MGQKFLMHWYLAQGTEESAVQKIQTIRVFWLTDAWLRYESCYHKGIAQYVFSLILITETCDSVTIRTQHAQTGRKLYARISCPSVFKFTNWQASEIKIWAPPERCRFPVTHSSQTKKLCTVCSLAPCLPMQIFECFFLPPFLLQLHLFFPKFLSTEISSLWEARI